MWDQVCKRELSGGKAFCESMRKDGLEARPVHDNIVKGEIPAEGPGLAMLKALPWSFSP